MYFFPVLTGPFSSVSYFALSSACFIFFQHNFFGILPTYFAWSSKLYKHSDWANPIKLKNIWKISQPFHVIPLAGAIRRFSWPSFALMQKTLLSEIWEQFVFLHFNDNFVAKTGRALKFPSIKKFLQDILLICEYISSKDLQHSFYYFRVKFQFKFFIFAKNL